MRIILISIAILFTSGCTPPISRDDLKNSIYGRWIHNPTYCNGEFSLTGVYELSIEEKGIELNGILSTGRWETFPISELNERASKQLRACNKIAKTSQSYNIKFTSFENQYLLLVFSELNVIYRATEDGKLQLFTRFDYDQIQDMPLRKS